MMAASTEPMGEMPVHIVSEIVFETHSKGNEKHYVDLGGRGQYVILDIALSIDRHIAIEKSVAQSLNCFPYLIRTDED